MHTIYESVIEINSLKYLGMHLCMYECAQVRINVYICKFVGI